MTLLPSPLLLYLFFQIKRKKDHLNLFLKVSGPWCSGHLYGGNGTAVETTAEQLAQPQGSELPGFAGLGEVKEDMPGTLLPLEQNTHNKQCREGINLAHGITGFKPCSLWLCYLEPGRRQTIMCVGTEWPGKKRSVSSNKPSGGMTPPPPDLLPLEISTTSQ